MEEAKRAGLMIFFPPRAGQEDKRPQLGGVRLAAQAGFRAPDHLCVWISTAEDADNEGAVCNASEIIEIDIIRIVEDALSLLSERERKDEEAEIAEYLLHLSKWVARGMKGRH